MVQTVFDQGDLITTRLKLGLVPDGTTNVSLTIYQPDGTTVLPTGGPQGPSNVDEWIAQFLAAHDGDYVTVWSVTGTGAGTQAKVFNVRPLPSASDTRPTWAPFLSEVADHVARLTVDTTPGVEIPIGTFNGNTSPDDEQAHRLLDQAVNSITARLGTVAVAVHPLARAVAALRAAASIARSFARSEADQRVADALDRRADAEMGVLVDANADASVAGGTDTGVPVFAFPEPHWWGDFDI